MEHHFNIEIAKKYGVNEAIFIHHIAYWVHHNKANNKNLHDNKYWTYNTQEAFCKIFPYWTRKNLRTIITNCIKKNLIVTGNYNTNNYDRTKWYSLSNEGLLLFPELDFNISDTDCSDVEPVNGQIELPKAANRFERTGQPIPNNLPNNKTYKKTKEARKLDIGLKIPTWLSSEIWDEFIQHRKSIKAPMSELAQKKAITLLDKMRSKGQDIQQVIENSIVNGWKGLFEIKPQGVSHGKVRESYCKNGNKPDWGKDSFDLLVELSESGEK